MQGWSVEGSWFCAGLMTAGAILLALRLRPRPARLAWCALLIVGLAHAVGYSAMSHNLININVAHYYLGAKYAFPYSSCYRVFNAANGRPQISMRDLEQPSILLREDPREQRAYYIDLMREAGTPFEPLAPLGKLAVRAERSGVLEDEAEEILSENLPPGQIADFRRDAGRALDGLAWGRDITTDYGFNGSPLYSLLRRADPTLLVPFGRATAYFNLGLQALAVLLLAWLVGEALNATLEQRLAMAALVFASWDFVGYAFPGLVFAGLWLPVGLALVAMQRRWWGTAGVAVAWAGLIKVFPFVLALPVLLRLVRDRSVRTSGASLRLLGGCAVAMIVLGTVALASGRSWAGFLHKIVVQFQSDTYLLNSVSFSQGLLTLGIHDSAWVSVLSWVALAVTILILLSGSTSSFLTDLPRRSLILLSATGWLVHTWFNYYTIAPLLLLPIVARRHRLGAGIAAFGMALTFALPEFDDPRLLKFPALHAVKLAPYLLIPFWLVASELRRQVLAPRVRRAVALVVLVGVVGTGIECWRMREIRRLDDEAGGLLDRGDAAGALERYDSLIRLAPRNGMGRMNYAIAAAGVGWPERARSAFARSVELEPDNPAPRQNYGRWLLGAHRLDEAAAMLESAQERSPHDGAILYDLARVRIGQQRPEQARALLLRAIELQPNDQAARGLLRTLGTRRAG